MIKLFRHLRQGLVKENKFSKYLLYALGEIILVVIGILIALQINNWNENRKNKIEEIAILESLDDDLILAQKQSESLISEEAALKQTLILILGIDSKHSEINRNTISDSIFESALWDIQSDQPVVNAYTNLKNTNKLSLIKDRKIKEKFTELEVHMSKLKNILDDRMNVHQIRIDNVAENDINFIPLVKANIPGINIDNEIPNDYNQILSERRIRNLLGMKLSITQDVIFFRENLDKEIKDLIALIELELEKQ